MKGYQPQPLSKKYIRSPLPSLGEGIKGWGLILPKIYTPLWRLRPLSPTLSPKGARESFSYPSDSGFYTLNQV